MPKPLPAPPAPAAGPALVWFRRDLRLADNPALRAALDHHETVVPVYVHAPDEEGAWKPGAASDWWLHHSLGALAERLKGKGAPLVIRQARTARAALDALAKETGATAVYWNAVYEPAFRARDTALEKHFQDQGLATGAFPSALLVEPWIPRTGAGGPYHVHSPYWSNIQTWLAAHPEAVAPLAEPRRLPGLEQTPESLAVDDLKLLPALGWAGRFPEHGTPGEKGAHARWDAFAEAALDEYRQGRNRPATDGSSRLSAPLHFGEVTPRQLWADVQARMAGGAANHAIAEMQAFLREVGWRDFTHHLLWHYPTMPDAPMNARYAKIQWRDPARDPAAAQDFAAWKQGRTGYPAVDAGLRQLWLTGFMHNRLRMMTAMALVKNLLIDWKLGEQWFWDTLVDADLANNAYNWQWVAGSGADPNPFFRVFNPITQGQKFDPDGDYVRRWVPELAKLPNRYIHAPWTAPPKILAFAGIPEDSPYRRPIFEIAASRDRALHAYRVVRNDHHEA